MEADLQLKQETIQLSSFGPHSSSIPGLSVPLRPILVLIYTPSPNIIPFQLKQEAIQSPSSWVWPYHRLHNPILKNPVIKRQVQILDRHFGIF